MVNHGGYVDAGTSIFQAGEIQYEYEMIHFTCYTKKIFPIEIINENELNYFIDKFHAVRTKFATIPFCSDECIIFKPANHMNCVFS